MPHVGAILASDTAAPLAEALPRIPRGIRATIRLSTVELRGRAHKLGMPGAMFDP